MRQLMGFVVVLGSCLSPINVSTPNRTRTLLTSSIKHENATRDILKTAKILPNKGVGVNETIQKRTLRTRKGIRPTRRAQHPKGGGSKDFRIGVGPPFESLT